MLPLSLPLPFSLFFARSFTLHTFDMYLNCTLKFRIEFRIAHRNRCPAAPTVFADIRESFPQLFHPAQLATAKTLWPVSVSVQFVRCVYDLSRPASYRGLESARSSLSVSERRNNGYRSDATTRPTVVADATLKSRAYRRYRGKSRVAASSLPLAQLPPVTNTDVTATPLNRMTRLVTSSHALVSASHPPCRVALHCTSFRYLISRCWWVGIQRSKSLK